jgi:hypothetical protein
MEIFMSFSTCIILLSLFGADVTASDQTKSVASDKTKAIAFEEVKIDLNRLKDWGSKEFTMTYTDKTETPPKVEKVGVMTFTVKATPDGMLITNQTKSDMPDHLRYIEYIYSIQCEGNNFLSLKKADGRISRSDGVVLHTESISMNNGKAIITSVDNDKKKEKEVELSKKAVIDLCFFYLVTLLPQDANKTYRIESYISISDFKSEPNLILCLGPDDTTGGASDHWIKFTRKSEKVEDTGMHYWVDKKGLLRRVKLNETNQLDLKQ